MSFADDNPGYLISSDEQARNWMDDLMKDLEQARQVIDTMSFGHAPGAIASADLQKAHKTFLLKHGGCLGTLMGLHRCGKLTDTAYNEMRTRILTTLAPKTGILTPH